MRYLTHTPSPALAETVEALWAYEGYQPPHTYERVFPSGTVEILLNLTDGRLRCRNRHDGSVHSHWSGLLVAGVHHTYQLIDTAQQYAMLGIALRPGGAWRLFGVSANELTDRHVPLEAILGNIATEWSDRLLELRDPLQRLQWLDAVLSRRALRPLHPAVAWATGQFVHYPDTARVNAMADEAGMSERRFHLLFQREIGINPKAFARIRRFQSALDRLRRHRSASLSLLSTEMGYSDQAHMIREFRALSGFTPTQYRSLAINHICHVPDPEQDQVCPVPAPAEASMALAFP